MSDFYVVKNRWCKLGHFSIWNLYEVVGYPWETNWKFRGFVWYWKNKKIGEIYYEERKNE